MSIIYCQGEEKGEKRAGYLMEKPTL